MIKHIFLSYLTLFISYSYANNKIDINNTIFNVGGTYDSMSHHPTLVNSCLNVANIESNLIIRNPHASLNFNQMQSLSSVQSALGTEFSSHTSYGAFDVNTNYKYGRSSQDDSYTLNLNYIYQYAGKASFKSDVVVQGKGVLTPTSLSILDSPDKFRKMCGDMVISELDASASLLMRLTLTFDSSVDKNYYDDSFKKVSGLQNVLEIIKTNKNNVDFTLNAAGIQVGGNPQLLNQLFIENGGSIGKDGYPVLGCGTKSSINPSCVDLINQVINYSQTLSSQLNSPKDFYFINPTLASWAEIGINAKVVITDPQVLQAMQQIIKQYNQDYKDLTFISNYKNMLFSKGMLSASMEEKLNTLINNYQQVINLYSDPSYNVMDCFNGFVGNSCLAIKDNVINARNNILKNSSLNELLIYLKTNQYLVTLFIKPDLITTTQCAVSPISESDTHLYMINCNGQASGTFDLINEGTIEKKLIINSFTYSYKHLDINYGFTYRFNQSLLQDSLDDNLYASEAVITDKTSNKSIMQNVIFTRVY